MLNKIKSNQKEQLAWIPLSKRRENSRLILFYKIINNLAAVPHSCLEKVDVRTRKNHARKFRHIDYNVDSYGQSFFPNSISAWNGLAKNIAEAVTIADSLFYCNYVQLIVHVVLLPLLSLAPPSS